MDLIDQAIKILKLSEERSNKQMISLLKNAFANVKFFEELRSTSGEQLYELCLKKVKLEEYEKDQVVCHCGDYGETFYIILTGRVKIMVPANPEI